MLNIEKLDKRALRDVAAHMGWDGQDATPREEVPQAYLNVIKKLSADEFTEKFLHWNGILGWSTTISAVVTSTLDAVELEPEVKDPNIVDWFRKVLDIDVSDLPLEELDYPLIEENDGDDMYIKFMSYGGKIDNELGKRFLASCLDKIDTLGHKTSGVEMYRWRSMRVHEASIIKQISGQLRLA